MVFTNKKRLFSRTTSANFSLYCRINQCVSVMSNVNTCILFIYLLCLRKESGTNVGQGKLMEDLVCKPKGKIPLVSPRHREVYNIQ